MRIAILSALVVVGASGCAQLQQMTGNVTPKIDTNLDRAAADVNRAGADLKKLNDTLLKPFDDAQKLCEPLKTKKVSWEEEREIGGAVALALASEGKGYFIEPSADFPPGPLEPGKWAGKTVKPPVDDKTALNQYINTVGKYLTASSDRPEIRWTFVVLDDPATNAFSAPGGYVFITTGLLKLVDDEAQLAAALAHEIGHVTGKDSVNAYMMGKYEACRVSIALSELISNSPGVDVDSVLKTDFVPEFIKRAAGALSKQEMADTARELRAAATAREFNPRGRAAGLIMLISDATAWWVQNTGYAKEREFAADAAAHEMLSVAGYDTTAFATLLKKLPDGKYFSPHPSTSERIAKYKALDAEGGSFGVAAAPANADKLKAIK